MMTEPKDTVATPEGDNEFAPDEPLKKLPEDSLQESPGAAPDVYRQPEAKSGNGD